jgi:uncharacterized membrane protein
MAGLGVPHAKAALSSGRKFHPATAPAGSNRSGYGGNEMAETFGYENKGGCMGCDYRHARTAAYLMLGLAFIGIIDAYYDSYAIYSGVPLWCPPPIDGCNTVASSPYAHILGLPVGYFGVAYYLCMFGLSALLAFAPISRGLRLSALLGAAVGAAFSIYFMYIQFTFIHAFCIYCLISAVLTLFLLLAALWHFRAAPMDPIPAPT